MTQRLGALVALAVLGGLGIATQAQTPTAQMDKPFQNFTLKDIRTGKSVPLYKSGRITVGVFMANFCSTTWRYEQKIGDLVRDYKKKGVDVVAIHSSYQESDSDIKGQMDSRGLTLPILDDKETQGILKYVDAACTPTFFIIDKKGVLRYQGAFDDRPVPQPQNSYVRPALDALLANKPVPVKKTRAFG